jgi:hypothetical protein
VDRYRSFMAYLHRLTAMSDSTYKIDIQVFYVVTGKKANIVARGGRCLYHAGT